MKINYFERILLNLRSLKDDNKSFLALVAAVILALPQIASAQCNYSLELSDSWGDGWNGGQIEVTTGTNIDTLTLLDPPGNFQAFPLTVNTGDTIILNYLGGSSYNIEVSFELKDVSGTSLYSSGQGPSTGVAFSGSANCPSCFPPTALGVNGLTSTSAFAIWQAGGTEAAWDLEYGTTSFTQGAGTLVSPTSTQYFMQNLTANTSYEFYVRANCNGSPSPWVGPFSFFTGYCSPSPSSVDGSGITNVTFGTVNNTTAAETGNYGDYSSLSSSHAQTTVVNVDITYATGYTYGTKIWVDWNDDLDFDDNLELVYTGLSASTNPTTLNASFTVPVTAPLGSHRMRIGGTDTDSGPSNYCYTGSYGSFEDYTITVTTAPSCPPPNALNVTSITGASASLEWTSQGTETTWDVEWGTTGFTPGTGTMVTGTTNPTSISGLTAQTSYEFYVRADCNGSTSSYTGPFSFTTPCATVTSFPYFENFDAVAATPACWAQSATNVENWLINSGSSATYGGQGSDHTSGSGNFAWVDDSQTQVANPAGLETPVLDLTGLTAPRLKFWFTNRGTILTNNQSKFYVDIYDGTSWNNGVDSIVGVDVQAWTEYVVDISAYKSSNTIIRFTVYEDPSSFYSDVSIDDVTVEETPSCANPTLLMANNVTPSSADLGWTAGGTETSWDIEWGTTGFSQGSGNLVSATSSNPYSLSGLSPNTNYQFYVRADCGNNDLSPWAGPFSFTTSCAAYTSGYYQNFDGTLDPNIDACWTVIEATATSTGAATTAGWIYTENSTLDPRRSGVNSIEIYNSSAMQGLLALVSPEFSDLDNTKRVRFYVQDKASTSYTSDLIVGVMSDPTDTSTFTPIDTVFKSELSANWLEVTVNLPTGLGNYVALAHGLNSTFDYMWIDDFYYENVPSCFKPSNFTASNVTATSADFTWTANSYPNNWEVEYGAAGYTPGTGTSTFVSDTLTTISNLSDATTYDFYVREICSAGDSSFFEGPVQLTTLCLPAAAPFLENFDGLALVSPYTALPNCWDPQTGPDYWDVTNGSTNIASFLAGFSDHTTGSGNYMWIDASGDITGNEMVSPMIDHSNLSNAWAGFWFGSNNVTNSTNHTISLDVWDGTAWLNIATKSGNFPDWVMVKGLVPSSVPTTTKYRIQAIAATGTTSSTYFQNDLGVDDFFVNAIPLSSSAMISNMNPCAGDTVMLYAMGDGGTGNYTYSWSGNNVINSSNDTAWVVANSSGSYMVSVSDGNVTLMDTVSVMVNAAPSVSISSSGSPWCDMVDLWVSSNGPGMAMWSNGASGPYTSVSLADGIAPNVSVMVMDTNGCVGSASWYASADEYLQNYVMVAKNSIELPKKNKVIGGGVGVTDLGGMASIGNFSGPESTNGFVIADNLNLGNSANYAYFADTTASALILPNHNSSNASGTTRNVRAQRGATKTVNARNVNVIAERNSTVTLTSNLYGVILVKVGATVIFTDNNVQIGDLYVQNSANSSQGATISFAQSCDFRVANYVYLGARSNFNPSMEDVTVYVGSSTSGGDFEFKPADTEINANIYVMGGNVKAASSNSKKWSSVNGRVIADEIYSKAEYIRWSGPTCNPMVLTPLAQKKSEVSAQQVEEVALTQVVTDGVEFTLAPNPTSGVFSMQLNGSLVNSTEDIQVTITSQDGRMVENKTFNNLSGSFNREFSLEKYSNGIYFVTILVGNEILKEKIVLTR